MSAKSINYFHLNAITFKDLIFILIDNRDSVETNLFPLKIAIKQAIENELELIGLEDIIKEEVGVVSGERFVGPEHWVDCQPEHVFEHAGNKAFEDGG
jgi:hypothetical protein